MAVIWPWCIREPLNPIRAVGYFSHFFEKPWKEMFDGQLISVPDMPRSYLPTLFGHEALTEILLLLGIPGLIAGIALSVRHDIPVRQPRRDVVAGGSLRDPDWPSPSSRGRRSITVSGISSSCCRRWPFLGGLAGAWVLQWLAERSRIATAAAAVVMVAGFAVPAVDMVVLHPYQYAHYNRISGGTRARQPPLHARLLGPVVQGSRRSVADRA